MLKNAYSLPFKLQLLYAALCIVWNAVALVQLHLGAHPIGPTASFAVIFIALILVLLLRLSLLRGWQLSYLLLSGVILVAAMAAVYSGMTQNADLWPSAFWRFAGTAVNVLGVISFLVVIKTLIKRR